MDNAPTRRPPNRSERRKPRGPRPVARKSEVERTRELLLTGAQALDGSLPEVSETLRALAGPFGSRMLTVDRAAGRVPEGTTNVTLMVPEHLRKALQDAALDAADSEDATVQLLLGRVVSEGVPGVLAGEVPVREIPRDPRGTSAPKVNMNIAVGTSALEDLRKALPTLGERLGFKGQASVSKVALRLLLDRFGMDYEPAPNLYKDLAQMQLHIPPRLAAAIQEGLAAGGADLRTVVQEGFAKVLSGTWQPFKIPKAPKGSDYERDILPVRVDSSLVDQVRAACPGLKERLGYRVTPPTIAIDYLIDELGLQDLADAEYGITAD